MSYEGMSARKGAELSPAYLGVLAPQGERLKQLYKKTQNIQLQILVKLCRGGKEEPPEGGECQLRNWEAPWARGDWMTCMVKARQPLF